MPAMLDTNAPKSALLGVVDVLCVCLGAAALVGSFLAGGSLFVAVTVPCLVVWLASAFWPRSGSPFFPVDASGMENGGMLCCLSEPMAYAVKVIVFALGFACCVVFVMDVVVLFVRGVGGLADPKLLVVLFVGLSAIRFTAGRQRFP